MTSSGRTNLSPADRRLLATFRPDCLAVRWDSSELTWVGMTPLFSLNPVLVGQLIRLHQAGLIEPVPQPDRSVWPARITEAGKTVLTSPQPLPVKEQQS